MSAIEEIEKKVLALPVEERVLLAESFGVTAVARGSMVGSAGIG